MDGFFKHPRELLQRTGSDRQLTTADRQILDIAMCNTRNPGDSIALGIDFLVRMTGLARSSVIRSRNHLVELGYLIPCKTGFRGLLCFAVATGSVDATGRTDATGRAGATGTGSVHATGTGSVDATHIDTGYIETIVTTSDKDKTLLEKDKQKVNPDTQGKPTPPPTPAPSTAKPKEKKARIKPNQHPTWRLWLRVNEEEGRSVPLEERSSLNAAKKLAGMIPDQGEQEAIMLAYVQDKSDTWAINQGLTLSLLVNSRLSKCRTAAAKAIEAQAEEDAELIRGAEEQWSDPDERAAFFYARKQHGLRVPPGVECYPMPEEKEEAV